MKRSYIREILDAINDETISFAGGLPAKELFPLKQIQEASNVVLQNSSSLQYSSSLGDEKLREQIASFYTKYFDFPTHKDEILITTGSQQAFDVISKIFVKKEVVVQSPTYIGALNAFKMLDLKIKEAKTIAFLNTTLNEKNAFYCMSDFQNPNTQSYSQEQREEVAYILNKKNSYLIEDGAYSFLDFEGNIQKPISALYKKSFHLGSFSKIIAPGLRVGWIRAHKSLIEDILVAKESLDLHTPTLTQMIISKYLEDNDLFEHLSKIRNEYKDKMEFMSSCFEQYLPSFSFTKPKGGMFIYGFFKEDSFKIAQEALKKNVAFVPATVFYSNNTDSREARFNFSNATKEQIEEGIKTIASLLENRMYHQSIWYKIFKGELSSF